MNIEFTVPIWEALEFSATSLAKNMWWMAHCSHQSSVIGLDLGCDWLISLICNHYSEERQLWQQKQKKTNKKVEKWPHRSRPDTLLCWYNQRNKHQLWWWSLKSPLSSCRVYIITVWRVTKCEQDKNSKGRSPGLCQKVTHISSGNSFCCATAVRTARVREKWERVVRWKQD